MARINDDDFDANDLLDRVVVNQVLSVSSSFSSEVTQRGFYNSATMRFSFRVRCITNYHGSDCTRFCAPQDSDEHGHYTCDSNGERVCRDGYTGVDCRTGEWVFRVKLH